MSYHFFYKKLEQTAKQLFPSLAEIPAPSWDHLLSPLELRLPKSVLTNAKSAIQALHAVSRRPEYATQLESVPGISDGQTQHESVLMAYDFHTNEAGDCFLVEINTNASGFLLSSLMELTHSENSSGANYLPFDRLRQAFLHEAGTSAPPRVAITDEDIQQQKMYAEFLMYRDWFHALGWKAEICEGRDFKLVEGKLMTPDGSQIDLVYNRLTDFYLENPQFAELRQAYVGHAAILTPNPREYWLLADKQRLIQLSTDGFLASAGATPEETEAIRRVVIPTFEKSAFSSQDEIWSQRRHLFFKPKRSYGGKSVYRGESVSRKVFERLMHEDILIQNFSPAQKMPVEDPRSVLSNWKFDVRFFVYGDQIQLVAARIYQGQVTNFASPLGGYTRVQF